MRILTIILIVSVLMIGFTSGFSEKAKAADQSITVTATGAYLAFTFTGGNWTLNGGLPVATNTWYYSNPLGETTLPSDPVVNGECTHNVTNTGNVALDITIKWANMTGAGNPWINSDNGTNGSMVFGAKAQKSGSNWSTAVIAKNATAFNTLISNLGTSSSKKVVFGFYSPTVFTDANSKSGLITLTATQTP